jgi:hypothetical protein
MLERLLEGELFADWEGEEDVYFPCLPLGVQCDHTNSTKKLLPMAEMKAITMYIVRRRGMRLDVMVC